MSIEINGPLKTVEFSRKLLPVSFTIPFYLSSLESTLGQQDQIYVRVYDASSGTALQTQDGGVDKDLILICSEENFGENELKIPYSGALGLIYKERNSVGITLSIKRNDIEKLGRESSMVIQKATFQPTIKTNYNYSTNKFKIIYQTSDKTEPPSKYSFQLDKKFSNSNIPTERIETIELAPFSVIAPRIEKDQNFYEYEFELQSLPLFDESNYTYIFSLTCVSKGGLSATLENQNLYISTSEDEDEKIPEGNIQGLCPEPNIELDREYGVVRIYPPEWVRLVGTRNDNFILEENGTVTVSYTFKNAYGIAKQGSYKLYKGLNRSESIKEGSYNVGNQTGNFSFTISGLPMMEKIIYGDFTCEGSFQLVRQDLTTGNNKSLGEFIVPTDVGSNKYYEDNTIEQGVKYNYGMRRMNIDNSGSYSAINWKIINGDFEDIILSDEERALRIQYDPKVSSFKTIIQEQKVETIGGKFPFFFRNGDVEYLELPLSGLLSYSTDEQQRFLQLDSKYQELMNTTRKSTKDSAVTLTPKTLRDEFYLERLFKLEVEKWLRNGKPKLLRTAAEGNYIVRLMDVSLSPNDQLARRLHTFSATAVQIAETTKSNLDKYKLSSSSTWTPTQGVDYNKLTSFTGTFTDTIEVEFKASDLIGLSENQFIRFSQNNQAGLKFSRLVVKGGPGDWLNFNGTLYSLEGGTFDRKLTDLSEFYFKGFSTSGTISAKLTYINPIRVGE